MKKKDDAWKKELGIVSKRHHKRTGYAELVGPWKFKRIDDKR